MLATLHLILLSFVYRTKERRKEKPTARQHPSTRPCVSLETPTRIRCFQLDSAAAQAGPSSLPPVARGASPPVRVLEMLRRNILLGFCIFLPFVVYLQSLGNGFVAWDDGLLITENPIITGLSFHNLWLAFTSYDPELYIPLTFLSYQINYMFGGLDPFGYHLLNLVLHIANAVMVGMIIRFFIKSPAHKDGYALFGDVAPWFAALLFAIHPLHTEAVVWAAARKDVLSAFFFLWTVLSYLKSREAYDHQLSAFRWYWLSVVMFLLALLSKVSVITWPVLMLLMDWYRGEKIDRKMIVRALPSFFLSVAFGIIALGGKIANTGFLWEKFLMGCRAVTLLLQEFFWPSGLSALYPFTKSVSLFSQELFLSVLFVLFVSVVVLWFAARRGLRLPLFVWGWFLLLLAPSFSNITKGHNELLDIYVTTDRYAYLPSVGLILACSLFAIYLFQRLPRLVGTSIFFILFVFSILSYKQSLVWKNTLTLFTHVAEVQPRSYVAWSNIGTEEVHRGRLNEGLQAYTKALQIRDDATTWYNVGQILREQGKRELAIEAYERAVESSPLEVDAKKALQELKMGSM